MTEPVAHIRSLNQQIRHAVAEGAMAQAFALDAARRAYVAALDLGSDYPGDALEAALREALNDVAALALQLEQDLLAHTRLRQHATQAQKAYRAMPGAPKRER